MTNLQTGFEVPTQPDERFIIRSNNSQLTANTDLISTYLDTIGIQEGCKLLNVEIAKPRNARPTIVRTALGHLVANPVEPGESGYCYETEDAINIKIIGYSPVEASRLFRHELSHAKEFLYPEGLTDYDVETTQKRKQAALYMGGIGVPTAMGAGQIHPYLGMLVAAAHAVNSFRIGYMSHSHEAAARIAEKTPGFDDLFVPADA